MNNISKKFRMFLGKNITQVERVWPLPRNKSNQATDAACPHRTGIEGTEVVSAEKGIHNAGGLC